MSLVRPVQRRKLDRIPDEKDGLSTSTPNLLSVERIVYRVVEYKIKIAIVGVELHRPTVHIANCISGSSLRPDSRDAKKTLGLLANSAEEAGRGKVGAVICNFEFAVCADYVRRIFERV